MNHVFPIVRLIFFFNLSVNPSRLKVVLADSYRFNHSSIAVERRVRSYKIHENYQSYTYDNDIGVIEMDRPVSLDAIIRTGCLPSDGERVIFV